MPDSPAERRAQLVLALDTTTPPSSVALLRAAGEPSTPELLGLERGPFGRGADAWIVGALDRLLVGAGVDPAELTLVVATTGPGAFTGIRVGLATAAGFAAGIDAPTLGVSTLEALIAAADAAEGADPSQPCLAVIDARRGQVYAASAEASSPPGRWRRLGRGPEVLALGALVARMRTRPRHLLVGSGAELVAPALDQQPLQIAEPLAVAAGRIGLRTPGTPGPLVPTYLRPPDAVPGGSPLRPRARRRPV